MSPFFSWQHAILKSALEPTTKHVCLTIGCHMAMDGSGCFPSYALIAEESGLGRSTVIKHVGIAVEAGYLVTDPRQRPDGSHSSNQYYPQMPVDGLGVSPCGGASGGRGSPPGGLGGSPAGGPHLTPHPSNTSVNTKKGVLNAIAGKGFDVLVHLSDDGMAAAKRAAPGWDIYHLARIYNDGVAKRGRPKVPDMAFPAWCSSYSKGSPPA